MYDFVRKSLSSNYDLDELLDIVNSEDIVVGQEYRSEIYIKKRVDFRVINGFLINYQNLLWIPRRALTKKLFPGCLDASVGGHVAAGEGYDQALERELREELLMETVFHRVVLIAKLAPHKQPVSAFMSVYLIYSNDTPDFNAADIMSGSWYSIDEIYQLLESGIPAKGDFNYLLGVVRQYLMSTSYAAG